ncbi:GntR family transcriptional regulator [Clostridium sp. WB02_MRS01]|uniref:GntR family transcriptional regulator n=1 Tax=Clostridium sp. WB02_MRS01 TaxID=2605777 RepID=UPI0012B3A688|nr:GntR family transcriptional regulator [Clostridium sp. WB02_MRS01]MSS11330.1 GntR family transcriptional regulator [Clostridium sp. WB02_MRS01]
MLDNDLPLYLAIAKQIRESILNSKYAYHEMLPTKIRMMKQYAVSKTTIRQAVNQLVEENLVQKVQGSGTFVTYRKQDEILKRSSNILPLSEELRLMGKTFKTRVISFEIINADQHTADKLGISSGEKIYTFELLRFGDGLPLCLEHSYMPVEPFTDLNIQYLEASKYNYVENIKHLKIAYSHQTVSVILSTERLENLLNLKKHSPLLKIQHMTYLECGSILDFTTIYFSSDRYEAQFIKYRSKET